MTKRTGDTADGTTGSDRLPAPVTIGVTASAVVMLLLLRLLAVSDWNWQTAGKIADSFDFSAAIPVLLGTLLGAPALTGIFLALLFPLVAMHYFWPMGATRSHGHGGLVAAVALGAAIVAWTVTFRSGWVVAGTAMATAALTGARLLWRKGAAHRVVRWLLRSAGLIALGGSLVIAAVVDAPWMSRETIVLHDRTLSGYVLDVQPGFVKVLTEDRRVEVYRTDEIVSRTLSDG